VILFLDFDGVLHPEPAFAKDMLSQLPLVEEILRGFPQVEIVISSAWRLDWKDEDVAVEHLRRYFAADIALRLVGVTPDYRQRERSQSRLGEYLREWECTAWLQANRPSGTPWLALDDRDWWFRPGSQNIMAVNCDTGFVANNGEEFRERLRRLVSGV
jgi:hypothetical protein